MNKMKNEIIVRIAAAAGDGVASMGELFAKICTRNGLYIHGLNYYQSIIRGGVTAWNIRASNEPVYTQGEKIDLLIALRTEAIEAFAHEVKEGGLILVNENVKFDKEKLAGVEVIVSPSTVNVVMSNTCKLPSIIAASTSATFSAVPAAQLSPSSEIITAPSAYPFAQSVAISSPFTV